MERDQIVDQAQAQRVRQRHESELMSVPGVVGIGLSEDSAKRPVIEVYVERLGPRSSRMLPPELEGIPVRIVETGQFQAR